jgi:hypothetical protein
VQGKSFSSAWQECAAQGGDLAAFPSKGQQLAVEAYFTRR